MKYRLVCVLAASLFASAGAIASEKETATKMVNEAAAHVEKDRAGAVAEIGKADGKYAKGESYVFAYDLDAVMVAHPVNPRLVGKKLMDVPDAEGKMFRKEIIEKVKSGGTANVSYKYKNPKTGAVEEKETYCKKASDLAVCAGYYK